MKRKGYILLILVAVFIDQALKVYIKTNYYYGQEIRIFRQDWFRLHFLENPGMAWGWRIGEGYIAKFLLTLLRLVAVGWGTFYLGRIIQKKYHTGFIICIAFIYAGALGNLIDSLFYGLIFEKSDPATLNIAQAFTSKSGYAGFMFGQVVDMWYFPIVHTRLPEWFPIWGGNDFEFFQPVFNTADVWVSGGVLGLLIFQKRFFKKPGEKRPGEGQMDKDP